MKKRKQVPIALNDLILLCLNVDYVVPSHTRDRIESLSVRLAKRHGFDTHEFRVKRKHIEERPEFTEKESFDDLWERTIREQNEQEYKRVQE